MDIYFFKVITAEAQNIVFYVKLSAVLYPTDTPTRYWSSQYHKRAFTETVLSDREREREREEWWDSTRIYGCRT